MAGVSSWLELLPVGPGLHHHLQPTRCTKPVPPPGSHKPLHTQDYALTPPPCLKLGLGLKNFIGVGVLGCPSAAQAPSSDHLPQALHQGLSNWISAACQPA